jgi:hypothetical protein
MGIGARSVMRQGTSVSITNARDLATWIYLVMLGDWDAVLIPELDYARVTFGHYRMIDCYSDNDEQIEDLRKVLVDGEPAAK